MTEVQVKVKDPKNEIYQVTLGRRKCSTELDCWGQAGILFKGFKVLILITC